MLSAPRLSRDLDLFHDTDEAIAVSWEADKQTLVANGNTLTVIREAPSFVEAVVARGSDRTALQWARDSAYRFFPLIEDELLGLALHPFDLATNKVLAMAGRLEVRDWIDVLTCDQKLQPFGYLVWAACGKDPGYNPQSLLAIARRQRYSHAEVATLDFAAHSPDATVLGLRWHRILEDAEKIVATLPPDELGTCVLDDTSSLCTASASALESFVRDGRVLFHTGSIGGVWPSVKDQS
ncbi:MAG: hypothetical protein EA383_08505 [Spirochaetaceae bacterium]|nr:MAG: hypothetical protein EA383_08505 [Spirochaetaceae bacterium]